MLGPVSEKPMLVFKNLQPRLGAKALGCHKLGVISLDQQDELPSVMECAHQSPDISLEIGSFGTVLMRQIHCGSS
jgi:hypothetical protein